MRISNTMHHERGGHVTIMNASRRDSGRYQCLIEDGSKKPPVEAIMVVVNCKNSKLLSGIPFRPSILYLSVALANISNTERRICFHRCAWNRGKGWIGTHWTRCRVGLDVRRSRSPARQSHLVQGSKGSPAGAGQDRDESGEVSSFLEDFTHRRKGPGNVHVRGGEPNGSCWENYFPHW